MKLHRHAATPGDEAHDLVAGHGRAAPRQAHEDVVEPLDVHAGAVGRRPPRAGGGGELLLALGVTAASLMGLNVLYLVRRNLAGNMKLGSLRAAFARASETVSGIQGAWVAEQKVVVRDGKVVEYRVTLKVTFVLGGDEPVTAKKVGKRKK